MRIPRIYVDTPLAVGSEMVLDNRAHHHISHVLRLKAGASLILFNGSAGEFSAHLSHSTRQASRVAIDLFSPCERESPLTVTLYQGISKGERMDLALQKSTELGVNSLVPVMCKRSAVQLKGERLQTKYRHWQAVITSAAEQSGRTRLPILRDVESIEDLPAINAGTCGFVLDGQAKQLLTQTRSAATNELSLVIGPEGGFNSTEIDQAGSRGYQAISLGPRTLRTETAALVALTAVQLLWGDLK